ncbi:Gypsy retrotransposon integrase-like protein 1 [Marasmius sp. AFHP31]|nr:Gypsy retrotransposon integrase-like protein 1 [Marasmius sp. AFHP31]
MMSRFAENGGVPERGIKKRRLQGACDTCKQKKVKCDSANMPGNICSNCIMFNTECTHVLTNNRKRAARKPATPNFQSPSSSQVSTPPFTGTQETANVVRDTPSSRQELTDYVLSASYIFPEELTVAHNIIFELATYARYLEQQLAAARRSPAVSYTAPRTMSTNSPGSGASNGRPIASPDSPSSDDEGEDQDSDVSIRVPMGRMSIKNKGDDSFFGKSSDKAFVKSVLGAKAEYSKGTGAADSRRSEFWSSFPWQIAPQLPEPPLQFPSPEVTSILIGHYFEDYEYMFPLLHRRTLENDVANGRHLSDTRFGLLLLSVCAIGSRFVDLNDPRMLEEGVLDLSEAGTTQKHSLGWKWFKQIGNRAMDARLPSSAIPDVCELQLICNYIMFAQTTSARDKCWFFLGQGIRYAYAVGVHRKSFRGGPTNVSSERELWKRGFWCLVVIDVFISAFLGRPRATNPAEYDIEHPIDCDDEYWDHPDPEQNFKQPPGRPSTMSGHIQVLKLLDIFGFAQCSLLAVRKSPHKIETPLAFEQEDQVVKELDKALNQWVDNIPNHLRWNPHMYRDSRLFSNQAANLYFNYYWAQIQIHRTFINGRGTRNKHTAYISRAVCANAARSSARLMDVQNREGGSPVPFPGTQMVLFNSAIVLLLEVWGGKNMGFGTDPQRDLNDVHTCLRALQTYEARDMLTKLISSGSDTASTPANALKRPRSTEEDRTGIVEWSDATFPPHPGSHRQWEDSFSLNTLPLYTEDLGRLPPHDPLSDLSGTNNPGYEASLWSGLLEAPAPSTSSWSLPAVQEGGPRLDGTTLATLSGAPREYR